MADDEHRIPVAARERGAYRVGDCADVRKPVLFTPRPERTGSEVPLLAETWRRDPRSGHQFERLHEHLGTLGCVSRRAVPDVANSNALIVRQKQYMLGETLGNVAHLCLARLCQVLD